jgi:hypothetical protein
MDERRRREGKAEEGRRKRAGETRSGTIPNFLTKKSEFSDPIK